MTRDYEVIYAAGDEVQLCQVGTAPKFKGEQLNLSGEHIAGCQLKVGQVVRVTIEVQESDA